MSVFGNESLQNSTENLQNVSGFHFPSTLANSNLGVAVSYWIIFIVGVTGNTFLLGVNAWRGRSRQQTTEMFMSSLAVFDLGLMFGSTWINGVEAFDGKFVLGKFMCKMKNMFLAFTADGSVMTLALIGTDRFFSADKPGNRYFSIPVARFLIVLVWVVSIATEIPRFLWFDLVTVGPGISICTISGVTFDRVAFYTLVGRIATFFVPFVVICISYFGIWYKISLSGRRSRKITTAPGTKSAEQTTSRKVARMCTMVVVVFFISWTPFQVVLLYISIVSNMPLAQQLIPPTFILANVNSCVNPIIYGFMWKPMKDALVQLMRSCRKCILRSSKREHQTSHTSKSTSRVQPINLETENISQI